MPLQHGTLQLFVSPSNPQAAPSESAPASMIDDSDVESVADESLAESVPPPLLSLPEDPSSSGHPRHDP
jgi:hypothetical protein